MCFVQAQTNNKRDKKKPRIKSIYLLKGRPYKKFTGWIAITIKPKVCVFNTIRFLSICLAMLIRFEFSGSRLLYRVVFPLTATFKKLPPEFFYPAGACLCEGGGGNSDSSLFSGFFKQDQYKICFILVVWPFNFFIFSRLCIKPKN